MEVSQVLVNAVTGKVALLARDRSINDATRRRTEIQARIT